MIKPEIEQLIFEFLKNNLINLVEIKYDYDGDGKTIIHKIYLTNPYTKERTLISESQDYFS